MTNNPNPLSVNPHMFGSQPSPSSQSSPQPRERRVASLEQLVLDLCDRDLRESALLDLSKKREIFQDLAPLLWHSFGTIAALLQEIVSIYPFISPPNLSPIQSNRVCNALALLQCVASHPDTRILFLNAHIPLYLYPFLNTTSKTRPFEYLRLTSLGVIGALVKVDDTEVIGFLLQTEIIPLCLRTMENGSELSKTVATFIVQKILLDDIGLRYICASAERFFAVIQVLSTMVESLSEQPSMRLLKHIIRCCLRLSDNGRACEALKDHLPKLLTDRTFDRCLREDPATSRWLQQLLLNVYGEIGAAAFQGGIDQMMGWNKEANLLFVESPVGVGFSYTNTSSDLNSLEDGFVANDAYSFLVNWLKRFPEYQTHDFYIAGESYAGHYVPQLAELVYERNKNKGKYPYINFKGFIVGNPETDDYYDMKGLVEYASSHTVISDQMYEHVNLVCDFKLLNWTTDCSIAMSSVFNEYNKIDIYNIYAPKCNTAQKTSSNAAEKNIFRRMRIPAGYDPCFSNYVEEYFNRDDVKRSFHANATGKTIGRWQVCSDSILNTYNFNVFSTLPIYSKLIRAGLRIWLYSGDTDGRVPVIGSRYCVESLGLPLKTQWQTWYHDKQVGGRFVEYHGMTMVTVRGAGHLVPLNKPQEALVLLNSFLMGQKMPS